MSNLKYLTTTQLFWDTLEKHRGHARYADIRAKIAFCVERKLEDPTFSNSNDQPFLGNASKWLAGIWHAKLAANPDVVLFYTLGGDTMNLAMIGSHHDYPHSGKNLGKSEGLGRKIRSWVERGHVATPEWSRIKWTVPADVLASPELLDTSMDELERVMDELELELGDAPIYERVHGSALIDQSEEVITEWLTTTDAALEAVRQAQTKVRAMLRSNAPGKIDDFVARPMSRA
jgi:hypothetical protein